MSYKIQKPITDTQRADFIVEYNHNQGLKIEDTDMFLFALEENEIMGEKEIDIEVPDYDEEGNLIIIEYEDTEIVIDYDEEGNPIGSHEITVIKKKQQTHIEKIIVPYPVVDPDWEEKQEQRREAEFNEQFFQTSLGYIRRSVTMQNGLRKDFLTDILPLIQVGVPILTYNKNLEQNKVLVTDLFINECKQQLLKDFYGAETI